MLQTKSPYAINVSRKAPLGRSEWMQKTPDVGFAYRFGIQGKSKMSGVMGVPSAMRQVPGIAFAQKSFDSIVASLSTIRGYSSLPETAELLITTFVQTFGNAAILALQRNTMPEPFVYASILSALGSMDSDSAFESRRAFLKAATSADDPLVAEAAADALDLLDAQRPTMAMAASL